MTREATTALPDIVPQEASLAGLASTDEKTCETITRHLRRRWGALAAAVVTTGRVDLPRPAIIAAEERAANLLDATVSSEGTSALYHVCPNVVWATQAEVDTREILLPITMFGSTVWSPSYYPFRSPAFVLPISPRTGHVRVGTAGLAAIKLAAPPTLSGTSKEEPLTVRRRFEATFAAALDERFEDGVESAFSRTLVSMIHAYSDAALWAIDEIMNSQRLNAEVVAEALRWVATVDHPKSYKYRLMILQKALRSPLVLVRDSAAVGLALMDDPIVIPALREAIDKETCEELRQSLEAVLVQLKQTAGGALSQAN